MQFINNKISFYTIDFDYTNYLYNIDNQVYFNPNYINETKPYIGIIVNVKNLKYFIPLTSAKTKHSKQRLKTNNYITIFETVNIFQQIKKGQYISKLLIALLRNTISYLY
ncbi:MAG TPA: type III toxin-antitoxin system ToxN/AbiQ family toxin [Candidatus Enterococcus stercoripullorum]|nr:type III toxin-antitoxin system ToxN/AbiQ family toxin [Candidatus Enterococcus stercoripullorum]